MKLAHFFAWAKTFAVSGFENVLVKSTHTILTQVFTITYAYT